MSIVGSPEEIGLQALIDSFLEFLHRNRETAIPGKDAAVSQEHDEGWLCFIVIKIA